MHVPVAQTVPPVQFFPPHCPYSGTVPPPAADVLALGALEAEDDFTVVTNVVPGAVEFVPDVAAAEVADADVAGAVTAGADEVDPDEGDAAPPSHPTRVEPTAISSYQKVLTSPPYDSQPK